MNLLNIFSTPMWDSSLPEFDTHKETFLNAVTEFREKNSNKDVKYRSAAGDSYQSPMDLTTVTELSPLFEFACQMGLKAAFDLQFVDVDAYVSAAWVNFNQGKTSYNVDHVHQDTFSGVFYLQVPEKSGMLVMNNSGMNPLWQGAMLPNKKNKFNADKIKIEPQEGHVFLWPSYLPHSVLPNNHDETRISISFNIICIPKEYVEHTK